MYRQKTSYSSLPIFYSHPLIILKQSRDILLDIFINNLFYFSSSYHVHPWKYNTNLKMNYAYFFSKICIRKTIEFRNFAQTNWAVTCQEKDSILLYFTADNLWAWNWRSNWNKTGKICPTSSLLHAQSADDLQLYKVYLAFGSTTQKFCICIDSMWYWTLFQSKSGQT